MTVAVVFVVAVIRNAVKVIVPLVRIMVSVAIVEIEIEVQHEVTEAPTALKLPETCVERPEKAVETDVPIFVTSAVNCEDNPENEVVVFSVIFCHAVDIAVCMSELN